MSGDRQEHATLSTTAIFEALQRDLDETRAAGLYREFTPCTYLADAPGYALHDGKRIEVWCTNDYLGMSQHPDVIRAQVRSTTDHGTGNGGSRNLAGTSDAHVALEGTLAAWHRKGRALIFNSGYIANFETLSTLITAMPDIAVFSDALNHRSLIEGIVRSTKRKVVFPHNDLDALERALAACEPARPKLIVFESVYSMDGDYAPIGAICDLADRFQALTFLDETHAIGVNGPTGAGLCEEIDEHRPTFIQGVFGKAVGTTGGYIAGPDVALDFVRSHAPGFIFTTTIPRSSLDATRTSLEILSGPQGRQLRGDLHANAARMKRELRAAGIDFIDAQSHLVPILVPGGDRARRVSRRLLDEFGIYVQPVNFPSVPKGGERFRVTVAPFRTPEEIGRFAACVKRCLTDD